VVLSSQQVDLGDALFTAGKDKLQAANPPVDNGQKLIPNVIWVFSKSQIIVLDPTSNKAAFWQAPVMLAP
jgi:hypothetical protein